jgi:hypothetical protein
MYKLRYLYEISSNISQKENSSPWIYYRADNKIFIYMPYIGARAKVNKELKLNITIRTEP